jgi:Fe-S cluster assembly scaffold protein SufB
MALEPRTYEGFVATLEENGSITIRVSRKTKKELVAIRRVVDQILTPGQRELDITVIFDSHNSLVIAEDFEELGVAKLNITFILKAHVHLEYICFVIDSDRSTLASNRLRSSVNQSVSDYTKTIRYVFAEPGASLTSRTVYFVGRKRNFKLTTIQDHQAPQTTSSLVVKSALEGEVSFTCDNLIRIHKDAQKVVAQQSNKNLLLSSQARATSVPKMEVEADDVSCKHGSATSKPHPDQLFYLQSRGLEVGFVIELLIQSLFK